MYAWPHRGARFANTNKPRVPVGRNVFITVVRFVVREQPRGGGMMVCAIPVAGPAMLGLIVLGGCACVPDVSAHATGRLIFGASGWGAWFWA